MENETTIIQIEWVGPLTFEEAAECNTDTDFGIYQIYGSHRVYGSHVLLYIGRSEGHFGSRIRNHDWWLDSHHTHEAHGRISVHLGKLKGVTQPPDDVWNRHIQLAERLLIYAHLPAVNKQKGYLGVDAELQNVHVCNWGRMADLLPEVSGLRWTDKCFATPMNIYRETSEGTPV